MKGLTSYVTSWGRETTIFITAFLIGAFLFVAVTVYGASVIGSAITGVGTSSPLWGDVVVQQQDAQGRLKGVFVVGDTGTTTPTIFVSQKGIISFGSSTPSPIFLNQSDVVIGRDGSTNDLYVSGGLGVGNATSSDGDFIVGIGASGRAMLGFSNNGRLVVGASSTAMTVGGTATTSKFVFDGGDATFSSGGEATTTLSIVNEAGANSTGGCLEMSADGVVYRVFINSARTGVLAEAGGCMNNN